MKIDEKYYTKNNNHTSEIDLTYSSKRNLFNNKYKNNIKESTLNKFNFEQISDNNKNNIKKESDFEINRIIETESSPNRKSSHIKRNSSILRTMKNKRKSEMMKFNLIHPLSYIESIKNIEDKNTIYGTFRIKLLIYDIIISLLSLCSIILISFDNNFYINNSRKYIKDLCSEKKLFYLNCYSLFKNINKRKITKIENSLRILNLICSVICCIFVNLKFRIYILNLRLEQKISKFGGLKEAGYLTNYFIQNIINLIFKSP